MKKLNLLFILCLLASCNKNQNAQTYHLQLDEYADSFLMPTKNLEQLPKPNCTLPYKKINELLKNKHKNNDSITKEYEGYIKINNDWIYFDRNHVKINNTTYLVKNISTSILLLCSFSEKELKQNHLLDNPSN